MKQSFRYLAMAAAASAVGACGFAQSLTLNKIFLTTGSIVGQSPNAFAYHAPSNEILVGTAVAPVTVYRYSGTNGAQLGQMNMTGVSTTDALGVFALGTDASGDITGFDNNGGGATRRWIFWANPTAVPTVATLTNSANFPRNMDAADVVTTAGTVTLLVTSAGENDADTPHVWQKIGGNYVHLGKVDNNTAGHPSKAGATISDDGQWILGSSTISPPNGIQVFRNGTGGPLTNINGPAWTHQGVVDTGVPYGDVAVDATKDVGFGLRLNGAAPAITMFRLSTRAILATADIDLTGVTTGFGTARGGLDLDKTNQRVYVFFRSPADVGGDATIGRFDYVAQTTSAQDWALFE